MFYVGQRGSLAGTVHLSPGGGMTLCGLLVPMRDRFGRRWWRQEFSTPTIADVLRRIAIERADSDPPCGNCLRIAELHPHRLLEPPA